MHRIIFWALTVFFAAILLTVLITMLVLYPMQNWGATDVPASENVSVNIDTPIAEQVKTEIEVVDEAVSEEAVDAPATIAGFNPQSYESRMEQGYYYAENGFSDFAKQEYSAAIELNNSDARAYAALGKIQYNLGEYEHAAANLAAGREHGDKSSEVFYLLVRAYLNKGDLVAAQKTFSDSASQFPGDAQKIYLQGLMELASGNHKDAQTDFGYLWNNFAQNDPYVLKSNLYRSAYSEFDLFQGGRPTHLQALLSRALILNEEYSLAGKILRETLLSDPKYRDAWILLGYSLYATKDYTGAKNAFERALELDPTHIEGTYLLGLTYARLGETDNAIQTLRTALKNGFQPAGRIHSKLAEIYFDSRQYQLAVESYEQFIALDGAENVQNYVRPIWIYLDFLGNSGIEPAVKLAQQAVDKFPKEAMSHNLLGWALIYSEEYDQAYESLQRAKALDPNLPGVYYDLGLWYEKKNDLQSAKENYRKAYEKGAGTSVGSMAAKSYNAILDKISQEPEQQPEDDGGLVITPSTN